MSYPTYYLVTPSVWLLPPPLLCESAMTKQLAVILTVFSPQHLGAIWGGKGFLTSLFSLCLSSSLAAALKH